MFPTLRNNAAAGYKGPVKLELLKGAALPGLERESKKQFRCVTGSGVRFSNSILPTQNALPQNSMFDNFESKTF